MNEPLTKIRSGHPRHAMAVRFRADRSAVGPGHSVVPESARGGNHRTLERSNVFLNI